MLVATSSVPQWIADLQARRMLDANEAALKFWRMTREQFLTAQFHEFIHPDEMPRWETYIGQGRWGESGPWKCLRGDGSIFYCSTRWQLIEHNGSVAAFVFPLRAGETPATMINL